jgi:hypothetical protein
MAWRSQGDGGRFIREKYTDVSTSVRFINTYGGSDPLIVSPGAKYTIFIQRVLFLCTTDAAQTLTVRDSASTPVVAAFVASSPGVVLKTFDFGADGQPMTQGKDIDISVSAAGLAGWVSVEAYARILPEAGLVPSNL